MTSLVRAFLTFENWQVTAVYFWCFSIAYRLFTAYFKAVDRLCTILLCLCANKILAVYYVKLYQKHHRLTQVPCFVGQIKAVVD